MQSLSLDVGARTFQPRMPANAPQARDIISRGVAARFIAWARKQPLENVVAEKFGGNSLVLRAAVNPAMTNVAGWAAELVGEAVGPFMALAPSSAYSQLAGRGARVSFNANGTVSVPVENYQSGIASVMFIGEGNPIPVISFDFDGNNLTPRKAAAIVVWTREMAKATPFTISSIFAQLLENYVGFAADTVLLGNQAATGTLPAGIGNGAIAVTPAASGSPQDRMIMDLHNLAAAISTPLVRPVYIMSTANASIVEGLFPGLDVIGSPSIGATAGLPENKVFCIDAGSFVSGEGDTADIDFGEEATLHMDNVPMPTMTSPTRSLFQTASVGARVISSLDWVVRGAGRVSTLEEAWYDTP